MLTMAATSFQNRTMDKSHPWNPANILFTTDYDCTLTVKDTCELLVWAKENALQITDGRMMEVYNGIWEKYEEDLKKQLAAGRAVESTGDVDRKRSSSTCGVANVKLDLEKFAKMGLDPRLESTIRAYLNTEGLAISASAIKPLFGDSSSLRKMLKQLAGLERAVNAKIVKTGILGGLTREEFRSAGKRATMQSNCLEFLSRLTSMGTTVHVISANWSRDIIYGGLFSLHQDRLFVHSNDLEYDEWEDSSGYLENRVTSAADKETIQQTLRKLANSQQQAKAPKMVVYFGDAHTDLLALLDADLGIVMGKKPALRNLLEKHGIRLLKLEEAAAALSAGSVSTFRQTGVLFRAKGWEHVEDCGLFGC